MYIGVAEYVISPDADTFEEILPDEEDETDTLPDEEDDTDTLLYGESVITVL